MTFQEWFEDYAPEDASLIAMHKAGAVDYLEAMIAKRKYAWTDAAFQAGRESMREECLQECWAEATDNGTAQRIANAIKEIP